MTEFLVREKTSGCEKKMRDFFFDTFFVPEGMSPLPREILHLSYYQKYFTDLGSRKGDFCFEAIDAHTNDVVGVVWTRIILDNSMIERNTPFLLISVSAEYRGRGIGSALLSRIISELKRNGYEKVVLTVHRHNRAVALYTRYGFSIYYCDDDFYFMAKLLQSDN